MSLSECSSSLSLLDSLTLCISLEVSSRTTSNNLTYLSAYPAPPPAPPPLPSLHLAHPTCHITFPRQPQEKGRGLMNWSGSLTGAWPGQGHTNTRTHTRTQRWTMKVHCVQTPSFTCHRLSSAVLLYTLQLHMNSLFILKSAHTKTLKFIQRHRMMSFSLSHLVWQSYGNNAALHHSMPYSFWNASPALSAWPPSLTSWAMTTPVGDYEIWFLNRSCCREHMRWITTDIECIHHPLTVNSQKKIDISS